MHEVQYVSSTRSRVLLGSDTFIRPIDLGGQNFFRAGEEILIDQDGIVVLVAVTDSQVSVIDGVVWVEPVETGEMPDDAVAALCRLHDSGPHSLFEEAGDDYEGPSLVGAGI